MKWHAFYADHVAPVANALLFEIPPGKRVIPLAWPINTAKFCTVFAAIACMFYFQNFSHSAYLITALHGSYGMLWLVKHFVLPDPAWDTLATVPSAFCVFIALTLGYWSALFITISQRVEVSPPLMCVAIFMYVFGVVLMLCTDTQKYFVLKLKKGLLISDGWMARSRNANYAGEIMLYASFALVSQSWIPLAIFATVWLTLFASRIAQKEQSFLKKPGGPDYVKRTSVLFPMHWWAWPLYALFVYWMIRFFVLKF